jgi:hypothetical protein
MRTREFLHFDKIQAPQQQQHRQQQSPPQQLFSSPVPSLSAAPTGQQQQQPPTNYIASLLNDALVSSMFSAVGGGSAGTAQNNSHNLASSTQQQSSGVDIKPNVGALGLAATISGVTTTAAEDIFLRTGNDESSPSSRPESALMDPQQRKQQQRHRTPGTPVNNNSNFSNNGGINGCFRSLANGDSGSPSSNAHHSIASIITKLEMPGIADLAAEFSKYPQCSAENGNSGGAGGEYFMRHLTPLILKESVNNPAFSIPIGANSNHNNSFDNLGRKTPNSGGGKHRHRKSPKSLPAKLAAARNNNHHQGSAGGGCPYSPVSSTNGGMAALINGGMETAFPDGAVQRAAEKAARSFQSTQPKVCSFSYLFAC